jgi:hypothetical protein
MSGETKKTKKTNRSIKKYNKTYYIDSCYKFIDEYDLTRLMYHLKRLGINEDPLMNTIYKKDKDYFTSHNIKLKHGECYQNYNLQNIKEIGELQPYFILQYGQYIDKRLYEVQSFLSNIIHYENLDILQKSDIYDYIKDEFPEISKKYFKLSFYYRNIFKYKFPKIYILRPISGSGGADIFYISSEDELLKALDYYHSNNKFFKQDKKFHNMSVLASEYIMNPLLYNKKKFHIRMYFLICVINRKLTTFLLEFGKMLTAAKPFNTKKPFAKEVHDSHFDYTEKDIFFPKDFNNTHLNVKDMDPSNIIKQMRTVLSAVTSIINNKPIGKLLYNNQVNGYNLCGVDFMVDDTGTVFLIEINMTPSLNCKKPEATTLLCNTLFDWISTCVLEPCFNTQVDASQHPTYLPLYSPVK